MYQNNSWSLVHIYCIENFWKQLAEYVGIWGLVGRQFAHAIINFQIDVFYTREVNSRGIAILQWKYF